MLTFNFCCWSDRVYGSFVGFMFQSRTFDGSSSWLDSRPRPIVFIGILPVYFRSFYKKEKRSKQKERLLTRPQNFPGDKAQRSKPRFHANASVSITRGRSSVVIMTRYRPRWPWPGTAPRPRFAGFARREHVLRVGATAPQQGSTFSHAASRQTDSLVLHENIASCRDAFVANKRFKRRVLISGAAVPADFLCIREAPRFI